MTNFESINIPPEDAPRKENKENKYRFTILHEQDAEKAKEEIKKLNEESKKLIDASEKLIDAYEEKKKGSDDLSA